MKEFPSPIDQAPAEQQPAQPKLDLPALAGALHVAPARRTDVQFGPGYAFALGQNGETSLELYQTVVRVTMGDHQLAMPHTPAQISTEGVIFREERSQLSVSVSGEVLFQYIPATADDESKSQRLLAPETTPSSSRQMADAPSAKEKVKSERHVGELGRVSTHTTKTGKLVAEVSLAVPDPERPGQKLFLKFAAFDELAATLRDDYRPGDLVTAIGVPHELRRMNNQGHHWTERQLYFVRPPKRHDQED